MLKTVRKKGGADIGSGTQINCFATHQFREKNESCSDLFCNHKCKIYKKIDEKNKGSN